MRLTHVHTCETYSHYTSITNRMACALVNNISLLICYFINIFFIYKLITIVTRHCVAATYYVALSIALYNILLLVPSSAAPHIKVILPPNSTTQEVTLFHPLWIWRIPIYKNKIFSIIMLSSKVISVSQSNCRLYLFYLTLTLLGYVFLV